MVENEMHNAVLLERLMDAADEWAAYVTEDSATMTLRKYLQREIDSAIQEIQS